MPMICSLMLLQSPFSCVRDRLTYNYTEATERSLTDSSSPHIPFFVIRLSIMVNKHFVLVDWPEGVENKILDRERGALSAVITAIHVTRSCGLSVTVWNRVFRKLVVAQVVNRFRFFCGIRHPRCNYKPAAVFIQWTCAASIYWNLSTFWYHFY